MCDEKADWNTVLSVWGWNGIFPDRLRKSFLPECDAALRHAERGVVPDKVVKDAPLHPLTVFSSGEDGNAAEETDMDEDGGKIKRDAAGVGCIPLIWGWGNQAGRTCPPGLVIAT